MTASAPARALVASSNALSKSLGLAPPANEDGVRAASGGLDLFPTERRGVVSWIPKHRHTGKLGNHLLEQLQPFSSHLRGDLGQARDVAARPSKTGNQAQLDGSAADAITMGIALSTCWIARAAYTLTTTTTSTLRWRSSAARSGRRSRLPWAYRYSMAMFFPSAHPRSWRPSRNA